MRLPAGVDRVTVEVGGHPFAALEAGRSGAATPVLFLHGFTGSKEDGAGMLAAFADAGHPALSYDARGTFETPGPADLSSYSIESWAADAIALARQWRPQPVHLVGHSFGGFVGRVAVIGSPSSWASLVLLSSGPGAVVAADLARHRALAADLLAGGHARAWPPHDYGWRRPLLRRWFRRRFFATQAAALVRTIDYLDSEPADLGAVAATGVPALVAYGAGETVWPLASLVEMARRLRGEPLVLPGCGHTPNAEDPAGTAQAIENWWRASLPQS